MFRPIATTRLILATFAGLTLIIGCGPKAEPSEVPAAGESGVTATTGLELYTTYCQGCHGPDGKGDGPVAPLLENKPADLTGLIAKYGEFPEELVATTIDGRAEVEAHLSQSREMPVWGNVWNDPTDPVSEERIKAQISALVEFIQAIQVAPEGN